MEDNGLKHLLKINKDRNITDLYFELRDTGPLFSSIHIMLLLEDAKESGSDIYEIENPPKIESEIPKFIIKSVVNE